ncbi:MAG: hypothetical protein A2133_01115 [Actinobacteria bacterium RBG_16_64_13]|nr:MAG: hypothetical protein A2133_01115 [Actinobacteria bacterium RBG_16_64_13]
MARLPLNVSKAIEAWKEISAKTGQSAAVILAGDPGLVALAQERFSSGGTLPATWIRPLSDLAGLSSVPGELVLVFVRPEDEPEALAALRQTVPKGGVIVAVDEGSAATAKTYRPSRGCTRLSFSDAPGGWRRLFDVCAEVAGEHVVALGRRYPAIRDAAAKRVIYRTAGQNALVGLVFFVPGADMPAMTLNQAKMALSIGTLYGAEIDKERAVELAGIVGVGLGMRALSRYLARSAPGIALVTKAAVGYGATVALGLGAVRYFASGAPASTGRVVAWVGALRR